MYSLADSQDDNTGVKTNKWRPESGREGGARRQRPNRFRVEGSREKERLGEIRKRK